LIVQTYQTLFVREHNRMCDVLLARYPNGLEEYAWTDEVLFKTARTIMSAKMNMVGNSYFLAYFLPSMPKPATPLSIFQSWYGENFLTVNPLVKYPWKRVLNPHSGAPNSLPTEFAVAYRWHDLIPDNLVVYLENNQTTNISLTQTAYNATIFKEFGLENILRGMAITDIPHFHSGVQNAYRNMKFNFPSPNEGNGFDLAAWQIEHERERGMPTFNEYIKDYDGKPPIKVRKTFEEFTSNPEWQQALKRLYQTPDDVDLTVGQEIDEEWWPHTQIPRSMLAINFFTLFKGSIVDRFSINYQLVHCLVEQKIWDCKPTNVLQELIWKKISKDSSLRKPDPFWLKEFDVVGQGNNLMWNIVTQNTDIKCLQKNVFFLPNPETNPIVCVDPRADLMRMDGPTYNKLIKSSDLHFLNYKSLQPYTDYVEKYGPVVHYTLSRGGDFVLLSSGKDVEPLFTNDAFLGRGNPPYQGFAYGILAGRTDNSLVFGLSNEPDLKYWARKREYFNQAIVPTTPKWIGIINEQSLKLTEIFSKHVGDLYEPFNDIRRSLFNIMGEVAYGKSYFNADPKATDSFYEATIFLVDNYDTFLPYDVPYDNVLLWKKTPELKKHMEFAGLWISKRLEQVKGQNPNEADDWITILANTKINDAYLTDEEVKVLVFDYILGGVGPGPFQIAYGMYLLGTHGPVARTMFKELKSVVGNRRLITIGDLKKLRYLANTLKEMQRYYPAGGGGIGGRTAVANTRFQNVYDIPAGTNFIMHNLWIHRHDYQNGSKFIPDRWNNPQTKKLPFLTFGGGSRFCPGRDFATVQASITLAHIVRNFHISYKGPEPEVMFSLSSLTKQPIGVHLTSRGQTYHDEL